MLTLGSQVTVASVIGANDDGVRLLKSLEICGVNTEGIFNESSRRTARKTRVIAASQQIVRIDHETRKSVSEESASRLCSWLRGNLFRFDVVLISDYKKGVLTSKVLNREGERTTTTGTCGP